MNVHDVGKPQTEHVNHLDSYNVCASTEPSCAPSRVPWVFVWTWWMSAER